MTRADEHLPFEQLAAGHALSALEPEEEQVFLRHLQACARCARDVAEHRETMAGLAYAADDADPPPSLLEGIRAGVRASGRAVPAARDSSPAPTSQRADPSPSGEDELARVRQGRSGPSGPARWTAVAAAAALVMSLGVWNATLRTERDELQERSGRLAAAVRELGRPGAERVPLTDEEGQVVAVAMVDDRGVSLVVNGLGPNERGTTYVLWAQAAEGGVRPVGAFDVAASDVEIVEGLQLQEGLDGLSALLVSREQGDAAPPAPGGPVLASGAA